MNSIFDPSVKNEVLERIDNLQASSQSKWGSMTVEQMAKHCATCEEYYLGDIPIKRSIIGRLIGPRVLKSILNDNLPTLRKNSPTASVFRVTENHLDLETEKERWKSFIRQYETFDKEEFVHWFFGKMSKDQLGRFVYRHINHHLTQFGV